MKEEVKKAAESVAKDKMKRLKDSFSDKLSALTEDEALKLHLWKLLEETADEAFENGKLSGTPPEDLEKMYGQIKCVLEGVFNQTEYERAEKYKHLFFTQRLVSDSLRSALFYSESIATNYECTEKGGILSAFGCMESMIAPPKHNIE